MSQSSIAFSYDYARVEQAVAAYLPQWRQARFEAIVAIARGGLAPALIASTALDVPLYALSYDRATRQVSWFTAKTPPQGASTLVIEDIAGRGTTLSDSIDFLSAAGYRLRVFTLAYDRESRVRPDFGYEIPAGFRAWFPWERESITSAYGATANLPDQPSAAYASWAIDLDGILLPDIPAPEYERDLTLALSRRDALTPNAVLPGRDLRQLPIITGRPEQDRARTQAWLDRHGFHGPLIMRDESRHRPEQTAEHKAQAIIAGGHTHYIESELAQAVEIARRVPVARVYWWNGTSALSVYASQANELDPSGQPVRPAGVDLPAPYIASNARARDWQTMQSSDCG